MYKDLPAKQLRRISDWLTSIGQGLAMARISSSDVFTNSFMLDKDLPYLAFKILRTFLLANITQGLGVASVSTSSDVFSKPLILNKDLR
jgi:hypothetical protein